MPKVKCSLFAIPLFLTLGGCGGKSYETVAGLEPLATPISVQGAMLDNGFSDVMVEVETKMAKLDSPIKAQQAADQFHRMQGKFENIVEAEAKKYGNDPFVTKNKAELLKHFVDALAFAERASLIKKAQLEASDNTDSTGEVAKYIKFSRQSFGNFEKRGQDLSLQSRETKKAPHTD